MKDKQRIFTGNVLKEGVNCWRKRKARRVAFLVDAASYYSAFVAPWNRRNRRSTSPVGTLTAECPFSGMIRFEGNRPNSDLSSTGSFPANDI